MLIDWFTVGAQALNFLILVWLMKRFLYKPILDAIDAREKRIAAELADADAKQSRGPEGARRVPGKERGVRSASAARCWRKARTRSHTERQRLLDEARQAADALSVKRQDALASELQSLQQDIARRSREEVFAIARKALADLAGTTSGGAHGRGVRAPPARA